MLTAWILKWCSALNLVSLKKALTWESTEGISDVRMASEWPLPGESMIVHEGEKPSKVIIFYDNHFALESAKE
jgi:hypothetical protein